MSGIIDEVLENFWQNNTNFDGSSANNTVNILTEKALEIGGGE